MIPYEANDIRFNECYIRQKTTKRRHDESIGLCVNPTIFARFVLLVVEPEPIRVSHDGQLSHQVVAPMKFRTNNYSCGCLRNHRWRRHQCASLFVDTVLLPCVYNQHGVLVTIQKEDPKQHPYKHDSTNDIHSILPYDIFVWRDIRRDTHMAN